MILRFKDVPMRKSSIFFLYLTINVILLFLMVVHASFKKEAEARFMIEKAKMVQRLGLTDLCLFTEASYTRHLSQADLHTPFQDYPMAFDYFPSGSLLTVPPHLKHRSASVSESASDKKIKKEGM